MDDAPSPLDPSMIAEALRGRRPATLNELKQAISHIGYALAALNLVASALAEDNKPAAVDALGDVGRALGSLAGFFEGLRNG